MKCTSKNNIEDTSAFITAFNISGNNEIINIDITSPKPQKLF